MKKKILMMILTLSMATALFCSCGRTSDEAAESDVSTEDETSEETNLDAREDTDDSESAESYATIQDEIAAVQAKYDELVEEAQNCDSQLEMNENAVDTYELWDDELNSLWDRLSDELDADAKESLLTEQREWITRKEAAVEAVGMEATGGSLQTCLEYSENAGLTEVRVYKLAGILAELRGEDFVISDELQATLDELDPDLDTVFEKFEGTHITNLDNGDGVIVQKMEDSDFDPADFADGAKWVVSVTGGDVFTDKDVYTYSSETITFKFSDGSYAKLSENMAGGIDLGFGADTDCLDEVVSSDE